MALGTKWQHNRIGELTPPPQSPNPGRVLALGCRQCFAGLIDSDAEPAAETCA
jgi:hypothetical protein